MSAASRHRPIVVDASVSTKWFLHDEELTEEAGAVLTGIQVQQIEAFVPGHFRAEVANAIRNAVRSDRITEHHAREALALLSGLGVSEIPIGVLLEDGFSAALRFNCALYDGLYIALAELIGCQFIHADLRLRNTLGGRFSMELWIEDYLS
jgi:predicted nucleic acid-binding protein